MYLIVGLGNPGQKYAETRHNIGHMVINRLADNLKLCLDYRRFDSIAVCGKYEGKDILLLQPLTFMNLSGGSVKEWADSYNVKPENILVVHDDLDLPLGKIKAVRKGGAGGHRGVLSIMGSINSMDFPRIKIGVGRPCYSEKIEDFVLEPFYDKEKIIVDKVLQAGIKSCRLFISGGIEAVMNFINSKYFQNKEEKS